MNAIELNNITMQFGNFKANENVTMHVKQNEIYAIIGENGAGKSTLMSVLFGLYKQTSGTIRINGKTEEINSPLKANELGVGMVHQHFKLVEDFSVLENITLNIEDTNKIGLLSNKEARRKVMNLMEKYNFQVDLDKKISKCTVAEQQRTEILKMLYRNANILIFDEPTAVLTPLQIEEFLKALKNLKAQGKTIILITHKLDEIKAVADSGTVIRAGKVVGTFDVKKTTTREMAKMMVGTEVVAASNDYKIKPGHTILNIENIAVSDSSQARYMKIKDMSFKVRSGEIVAIAGVSGNGQTELINAITGLQKVRKGKIELISERVVAKTKEEKLELETQEQKEYKYNRSNKMYEKHELFTSEISHKSIAKRFKEGISHIPEDRHKYGMVLDMALWENAAIQDIRTKKFSKFGFIKFSDLKNHADVLIDKFDVRSSKGRDSISRTLSGGNQQKFIVARELMRKSSLIVTAQPTRGLDVGAIQNIHEQLLKAKKYGKGILLISYELDEVMSLADRIIVVNDGAIVGEVQGKGATRASIGNLMAGKVNNV
ncbi:ABC transporter ATP-binding protein [Mycoplasma todarodis]|uniref:Sugar ABC transporter ATP-binding protein n=1 Tax=Mycoplasma todarodis TaxID=1937191 RepID=A0A4R0XPK3_9MOLU|nr:ABC transporter ATP-binding protein [Mycoplasma todarodis]TCG11462.1 sugar ABC transporter ATP-binding protein [Mycoplasma todarodis]